MASPLNADLLNLSENERAYATEMRMLAFDRDGREVFIGLDRAETDWYRAYLVNKDLPYERRDRDLDKEADRFLELCDKHELQRRAVLVAENEARFIAVRN